MNAERLADAVTVFAAKRGIENDYLGVYILLRTIERVAEKLGSETVKFTEMLILEPFGELANEIMSGVDKLKDEPIFISAFENSLRRASGA